MKAAGAVIIAITFSNFYTFAEDRDPNSSELKELAEPNAPAQKEQVIKITAKKFEFNPKNITLKKGVPVTFELISLDRKHGFNCEAFGIRSDVLPDKTSTIRFTPDKTGKFEFHCDVLCGVGHGKMKGEIVVTE